jgi:hypothetical protein
MFEESTDKLGGHLLFFFHLRNERLEDILSEIGHYTW